MMLSGVTATLAIAVLPLPVLIVIGSFKLRRKKRQRDLDAEKPEPPFEPAPTPEPPAPVNTLLARFPVPQRVYLRDQFPTIRAAFLFNLYLFLVLLCCGLLPQFVDQYGVGQPLPQRVWYSYLKHLTQENFFFVLIACVSAVIVVWPLMSPMARFERTRPIPHAFLFWSRVIPVATALLGAFATAAASSFLLLLALHGPVWKHLDEAGPRAVLQREPSDCDCDLPYVDENILKVLSPWELQRLQAQHAVKARQTSPMLALLSAATWILLSLSSVTALIAPVADQSPRVKAFSVAVTWLMLMWNFITVIVGDRLTPHWGRQFFLYTQPGPPPPLVFALVPILSSIALLYLAEFFASRLDFRS